MTTFSEPDQPRHRSHQEAFEVYVSLGASRTYRQVAEKLGVSLPTVKRWAKVHAWISKIDEREAQIARQMADQTLHSSLDEMSRNRKLVTLALNRLAKAILNGQVKYQLADVDRLIRLQAFLDGRTDSSGQYRTPEEFVDHFRAYFQSLTTAEMDQAIAYCERCEGTSLAPTPPAGGALPSPVPEADPAPPEADVPAGEDPA